MKGDSKKSPVWIESHLAPIRDILRTREYDMLGYLSFLSVLMPTGESKLIDFRCSTVTGRSGPAIARARQYDQLVIVSPWEPIPDKVELSDTPCPSCLAKCDLCSGTGKKLCEAYLCGGSGTQNLPTGDVTCKTCQGSGQMKCTTCKGSGKRGSGRENGSYDFNAPRCKACNGSQFERKTSRVMLSEFESARVGPSIVIGPVEGFTLLPIDHTRRTAPMRFRVTEDYQGDPMVVLLESDQLPTKAYLLGGLAKQI